MDIGSSVIHAINGWLQSLATGVLQPALDSVGLLLFQTPSLDAIPAVQQITGTVRGVSNSLFVLAILGCGALIMGSGTFETQYTAKRLLPRLGLAAVLSNASLVVCATLTTLDNGLVLALLGPDPARNTWGQLTAGLSTGNLSGLIIFVFIALVAAVMAVLLSVIYVARDLLLLLLTVAAPLMLATYAVPQTEEIARLWWRGYTATLFVQVVHALLVGVGVQLVNHAGWLGTPGSALISALMLVALLYLMVKVPLVAYRWVFRHPVSHSPAVRGVVATVRTVGKVAALAAA
ncbi:MAG: type IV secretion system protein [Candidatus Dormibacteria bacterium]